jgi:hypothetical protein
MLHVTCCAAPRDTFGRLLSPLEPADGLLFAVTLAPGETSPPLPPGSGLLTLVATVPARVAILAEEQQGPPLERLLPANETRVLEARAGLRVTWTPFAPTRTSNSCRTVSPAV